MSLSKPSVQTFKMGLRAMSTEARLGCVKAITGKTGGYVATMGRQMGISTKHLYDKALSETLALEVYGYNPRLKHLLHRAAQEGLAGELTKTFSTSPKPADFLCLQDAMTGSRGSLDKSIGKDFSTVVFTHSTRSQEGVDGILATKRLENRGESTGVASQPGICMSTDMLSRSATDALNGKLSTAMFWYTVSPEHSSSLRVGDSAYALSDRTTVISDKSELPINVIMYTDTEGTLTIVDEKKFLEQVLGNIMKSTLVCDAAFLMKGALWLDACGYELVDKDGKKYSPEDLTRLRPAELGDIILSSIKQHQDIIWQHSFISVAAKLQIEGLEARGSALIAAQQLVDCPAVTSRVAALCIEDGARPTDEVRPR